MKTIVSTLILFIFLVVMPGRAEAQSCKEMQEQIDEMEKRLEKIENLKLNYEDFFSLMDDPGSTEGGIAEEIANCEHRINRIQEKITDGDKSAETATELKSVRSCLELLNLRNNPANRKAVLLKDPRYLEQQRIQKNLSSDQTELKMEVAKIGLNMQNNNCPVKVKKPNDDLDDIITAKTETVWTGTWKASKPEEETTITMVLNGTSPDISGTATVVSGDISMQYQLKGCRETAPGRLNCNFTLTVDDYEKFVDRKGTVLMTLPDKTLNSTWQVGSPVVRWKPNAKQREVIPDPPSSFKIDFKR